MRDTALFFAVFLLGCGIVGLAGLAVLWIWGRRHPEPSEPESTCRICGRFGCTRLLCSQLIQDELNRIRVKRHRLEQELIEPLQKQLRFAVAFAEGEGLGVVGDVGAGDSQPHPFNWETRQPMIWGRS